MRLSVVAFALMALFAIGAGVAIAGLPADPPDDLVIDAPPATNAPTTTTIPPTTSTVRPTTTTVPEVTTTTVDSTTTTTITTTTTEPGPELVDRAALEVGVANAAGVSGVASAAAEQLLELGYQNVFPIDAEAPADVSLVFHQPGLELEAARLAADLDWGEEAVAPYEDMPPVVTTREFQLVALIGTDRA